EGAQALTTRTARRSLPLTKYVQQLAGKPSKIDTNGAYHLTRDWLASIEVDLPALEKAHPWKAEQWFLKGRFLRGPKPVPVFDVKWGNWAMPTVSVMIAGDTKEILNLRLEDDSYSKRPVALIKDLDKLLAISDEEF